DLFEPYRPFAARRLVAGSAPYQAAVVVLRSVVARLAGFDSVGRFGWANCDFPRRSTRSTTAAILRVHGGGLPFLHRAPLQPLARCLRGVAECHGWLAALAAEHLGLDHCEVIALPLPELARHFDLEHCEPRHRAARPTEVRFPPRLQWSSAFVLE